MPNLPTHLSLASQTARRMANPTIERHRGSFLLGSTSPDIRIMTKWKRDQTHFAPLTIQHIGTGVKGLFQTHPTLADCSRVNSATEAFLLGYLVHLVADEAWILEIYRSYFDDHQLFEDRVRANIWDRALQLDMDKAASEELHDMEEVRCSLEGSELGVEVEFISTETLGRWREWVTEFTTWEFTWDRLRFLTRRMYQDDAGATEMVEEFLRCVPTNLKRIYDVVPEGKLSAYREKVVTESMRLIKEYLSVPASD